jgi:hypothetical protein
MKNDEQLWAEAWPKGHCFMACSARPAYDPIGRGQPMPFGCNAAWREMTQSPYRWLRSGAGGSGSPTASMR